MRSKTCYGSYLYSVGTHRRNMFKLLVNMSRVTYFFRGPTRETVLAETNAVNMQGEDVEKNDSEWNRKVEIRTWKKFLAVDEAWPRPGFKRRTFVSSVRSLQRGPFFLRPRYPTVGCSLQLKKNELLLNWQVCCCPRGGGEQYQDW